MRVETITHTTGEQLPILLDEDGLPMPAPNEFIIGRRSMSINTLVRNLREIAVFYRWLNVNDINLWFRIQSGQSFSEAEVRGGLIEALRRDQSEGKKVSRLAVSPNTFNQRVTTIRQFIVWCFDLYLSSMALTDLRYERIRDKNNQLLKWLNSAFINSPPVNKSVQKGLSHKEVQFLVSCIDPENPNSIGRNPAVRFRNYIITMIMLYYGLRPGEILSLLVKDIEIGAISAIRVERRPADKNDLRRPRPQIKRNGRVLPVEDHKFAKCIDQYIMIYREALEVNALVESDYLFLSDDGRPLSQSSITQLYQGLRKRFPESLPKSLTAKSLRHTFSSKMEKELRYSGLDEDRRMQELAILRGDSSLKSQSVYIAQEIEEQANRALRNFQTSLMR